jgi:hypothetical protein
MANRYTEECVDIHGNNGSNGTMSTKGFYADRLFWQMAVPAIATLTVRAGAKIIAASVRFGLFAGDGDASGRGRQQIEISGANI